MEMEGTRRPFERARELGLKRARLAQVEEPIDRNSSMHYRDRERDTEQQEIQELVAQYRAALAELTSNSKPIITNLTIIAGENLHAAKAVAATVCANILEVPSDQKLPSLYLLDSIVKNIGRDYIKYFGARLPEVFCKAYRQVDPSTHPGMRHLFGTWKGVFPPQPLQMIEKELAFPLAANGSSSGSATSKSESQSQRPANSIHVNPKYLEARQRLQQPTRDAERLDRAVGISSGRQWPEPTLKTQSTLRQRDAPDDFVREKNIVAAYGSYDNDSDHSSQSGLEMGRVKKRVIDNPLYGANTNLEEKMPIRRNGLDIKQSFPSYAPSTVEKNNVHLLPKKSIFGKSGSGIDESWKNSDEEEYMWDDLNSKPSDHHAVGISQKHRWTPDEPNRSGLENSLWRPQNLHDTSSRIDREASADALSTERKDLAHFRSQRSPSWTEEPHLTSEAIYSGSGRGRLGKSEGFNDPLSGVSLPANSLTRTPIPSHMSPSHVGTSNFENLTNPELIPSVGQKRHFVPDYLAEQDYHPSQLPRRSEMAKPQFSVTQNIRSQFTPDTLNMPPQDTLTKKSPKNPLPKLQTVSPMVHSVLPRHHVSVTEPSSQLLQSLLPKVEAVAKIPSTGKSLSNQASKNSVVGSVKKNEKVVKKSGTITKPSLSGHKITRPDPRLTAGSSSSQPSQPKLSVSSALSHIKAEQPPLPPGPAPSSQASDSASDPVSSLLSTLMAKGLITASKSESPTSSTKQISTQNSTPKSSTVKKSRVPVSSMPVTPIKKNSPDKDETPKPSVKCSVVEEVKPLIGFEFKPDVIRQSHPSVISELLENLPHQCDLCGLRLKLRERFERHLEWHALRNPEANSQEKKSRRWYANQENWVAGKDVTCIEEETSGEPEQTEAMVPADESQCVCVLCGEIFEDVYSHKTDEWMFKGSVYLTVPLGDSKTGTSSGSVSNGPIVHSNCISENSLKDLGFPEA